MPYSAKAIANYFLDRANAVGWEITPMKMQKLVYIAHGWNLAIHGEPLFGETVEAWRYGPVIPSLYQAFKKYGASVIVDHADGVVRPVLDADASTKELLDKIMDVYGKMSALNLMQLTHTKGSPWRGVREEGDVSFYGEVIHNEVIRKHFVQIGASARERRKKAA